MSRCKQLFVFSLIILPVLFLSACSHKQEKPPIVFSKNKETMLDKIRYRGAQVVQQGDRLVIILPTDKFFRSPSIELLPHQKSTMKLVASYLKHYMAKHHNDSIIKVSGYTDTVFLKAQRDRLSHQYAEVIASYLWNQGFSHQQLKVKSFGAKDTVANPKTAAGSGDNRRVVIQVN